MSNVIPLGNITKLDQPPDRILEQAVGKLDSVIIMGTKENGEEFFASSIADGGTILWIMERWKKALLEVPEKLQEE
ncbi:MAG: hypothetical protein V3W41_22610 [Planctomycetota bacterium]